MSWCLAVFLTHFVVLSQYSGRICNPNAAREEQNLCLAFGDVANHPFAQRPMHEDYVHKLAPPRVITCYKPH